jgi:aminoglycoside phosphotransferase (APT) family kinase protein
VSRMPASEFTIDAGLVRRLLQDQHQDLAGLPISALAHGWDNELFRLGSSYTVRLPRRQSAVQLLLNEQRWLPVFAARATVALPVPVRHGESCDYFPWPWTIAPWLPGRTALASPARDRAVLAPPLARFVADFHRSAPLDAPSNPVRGTPLGGRDAAFRARVPALPQAVRAPALALWQDLLKTPAWTGPPQWLHGDLHPGNLLMDDGGLAAVLDFGDLCAGDPATDLATAWLTFDDAGRDVFRREYFALRAPDEDIWLRARGWALNIAVALLAASDDHPPLHGLGRHALGQVLGVVVETTRRIGATD